MNQKNKILITLNKLLDMGKPMSKKQQLFLEELRQKVKVKEITVDEAHRIWNKRFRYE